MRVPTGTGPTGPARRRLLDGPPRWPPTALPSGSRPCPSDRHRCRSDSRWPRSGWPTSSAAGRGRSRCHRSRRFRRNRSGGRPGPTGPAGRPGCGTRSTRRWPRYPVADRGPPRPAPCRRRAGGASRTGADHSGRTRRVSHWAVHLCAVRSLLSSPQSTHHATSRGRVPDGEGGNPFTADRRIPTSQPPLARLDTRWFLPGTSTC